MKLKNYWIDYHPTNREKNKEPKRGHSFWCWRCDGYLISVVDKKCFNCGKIYNKKNSGLKVRYKK